MSMRALMELKEMFCGELDSIAGKKDMSAGDLETVHKLTDTIKNIDKIMILDESGEYSQSGDWEMRGYGTYGHGASYAARRNTSGRQTTEPVGRRYSRGRSKEMLIERLDAMMDDTSSKKEMDAISRCIAELEKS